MATSAYFKFNCFVEDESEKKHDFANDTFTLLLTNTAPVATNTVAANISQISYTNISSRVLTGVTSVQSPAGTLKVDCADLTLTASGVVPTFRYVVVSNSTAAGGPLVCWFDFGGTIDMVNLDTLDFIPGAGGLFTKT